MNIYERSTRQLLAPVRKADNFVTRGQGLLFAHPDRRPEALWIVPCNAVHTIGMRRPLDVLFIDKQLRVIKIAHQVRPFMLYVGDRKAHSVLEFFSGKWDLSGVKVGDQLEIR